MTKPLKALLFKIQDDNSIAVKGPISAQRAKGIDVDYVVLLCDHETKTDPKNAEDLEIFKACLMSSTVDANPLDQMCTLSYMLGTTTNLKLKEFSFDKLVYEGL